MRANIARRGFPALSGRGGREDPDPGQKSVLDSPLEAELLYGDGRYSVRRPGQYVRCAVTGEPIALEDLRYWSVGRQEAYVDAAAALAAKTGSSA